MNRPQRKKNDKDKKGSKDPSKREFPPCRDLRQRSASIASIASLDWPSLEPVLLDPEAVLVCGRARDCRVTQEYGLCGLNRRVHIFII